MIQVFKRKIMLDAATPDTIVEKMEEVTMFEQHFFEFMNCMRGAHQ